LKPQTEFRWNLVPSHEEKQNLNKNGVEEMFRLQYNETEVQVYAEFPGCLQNFAPWWFLSASPLGGTSPFTGISREKCMIL